MGKLTRNAIGGVLALAGAYVVLNVLHVGDRGLLGWFLYCAAVGYGANRAHGDANAAAIDKGLEHAK